MTESNESSQGGDTETASPRRSWRNGVAAILALLMLFNLSAGVYVVWLSNTITDEDQFVSTFEPLLQDEAVALALSLRVANGVVEATDMSEFVGRALPDGLAFLALPLTRAVRDQLAEIAHDVITSDGVTTAWSGALRTTHKAASAVLTGNDGALIADDGQVALDLNEIVAIVVEQVEQIGLDLPETDLQVDPIVLYQSDQLAAAQNIAAAANAIGWIVWLILLVLSAVAIWVAADRRWIVAFIGFGGAIVAVIDLVGMRIARAALLNGTQTEVGRAAAASVWDTTTALLVSGVWAVGVLFLIIGIVAWARGPSETANRLTASTARVIDRWRDGANEEPSGFAVFLGEWKRLIRVVAVTLGFLFLLFGPAPSGLLVIATAAVVLGVLILVEVLAGPSPST